MTHYTLVVRWTERQGVGGLITRELAQDVTDSMRDALAAGDSFDAAEEALLENAGYKAREAAGNAFDGFTYGSVDAAPHSTTGV